MIDPRLCGRCLIQPNATTSISADGPADEPAAKYITDVNYLKAWAITHIEAGRKISINGMTNTFEAVSTWQGDPVCVIHLWHLVEAENRRGYR